MINEKEIWDFIESTKKEAIVDSMKEKAAEIVEIFKSPDAKTAAKLANSALSRSDLNGVTENPKEILDNMQANDESITLSLTDEDDRVLRYDAIFGSGIFSSLNIKRNL